MCLDETLEAQAMSISMATRELNIASVKSCDISGLSYMVTWMKKAFPLKISGEDHSDDMVLNFCPNMNLNTCMNLPSNPNTS